MRSEGSVGRGLLQSDEEWGVRNRTLADTLGALLLDHLRPMANKGLDVGCQKGALTDALAARGNLRWYGVDPRISAPYATPSGAELGPGSAHDLPFPDEHFDCALFANVYEHVDPKLRRASLAEIQRVLRGGGIIVGQLPNPYFPIESHSRLPFMGYLPIPWQRRYWRIAPVSWEHDFYVVTIRDLRRQAASLGLEVVLTRNFSYPVEAVPSSVRWAARILERPMKRLPWAWQFVLRKDGV